MHYFRLFWPEILKPRVNFSRVWTKKQIVGKFWEIFEIFQKISEKIEKIHYLSKFFKKLTNLCVHFSPFGRKLQIVGKLWAIFEIFDKKFNRKIEFLASFGKVVAKNRAFGNNTIFYNNLFDYGGGAERSLGSPLAAPMQTSVIKDRWAWIINKT